MYYKRLEIYVWWTCNQKCTYCIEYGNMQQVWWKKVSKLDILKKLIKYKKLWYNHVTYLWWEPFIQEVFLAALIMAKKLWYKVLVTTNCTTLHIWEQAEKYLPFIDELFLSIEALKEDLQKKISWTNNYISRGEVFKNIKKYWNWDLLKVNIVITKDNLLELFNIVKYLNKKNIKDISITYPDINYWYYWKEYILKNIAPSYSECINEILPIIDYINKNNINLRLPDFPFCVFPVIDIEKYIKLTDDYNFAPRLKINHMEEELERWDFSDFRKLPRKRRKTSKCNNCKYNKKCWWPSYVYKLLYWLDEINPIF